MSKEHAKERGHEDSNRAWYCLCRLTGRRVNKLSPREELLLQKFHDGRCRLFERWTAERLLAHESAAREFVAALTAAETNIRRWAEADRLLIEHNGTDLWTAVSRRIADEKRSELFLGRRVCAEEARRWWAENNFFWSLSGAAAGACMVCLVLLFGVSSWKRPGARGAENATIGPVAGELDQSLGPIQFTSGGAPYSLDKPSFQADIKNPIVEMEWIHSDGRVRLIQHSSRRSPVIWVNRRSPGGLYNDALKDPGSRALLPVASAVPRALFSSYTSNSR
jgi:hypothetical protein